MLLNNYSTYIYLICSDVDNKQKYLNNININNINNQLQYFIEKIPFQYHSFDITLNDLEIFYQEFNKFYYDTSNISILSYIDNKHLINNENLINKHLINKSINPNNEWYVFKKMIRLLTGNQRIGIQTSHCNLPSMCHDH
jgi:hypothetical protein